MNIAIWLARQANLNAEQWAIFHGENPLVTYAGWHDAALRCAGGLIAKGVAPGDRVALFMPNRPEFLIALYGIWYAGAVAVPINAKLHPKEAGWIIANAEARILLTTLDMAEVQVDARVVRVDQPKAWGELLNHPIRDMRHRDPQDLAWLFYTSGTTGRPKGVMITHRMLVSMSLCYQTDCDSVRSDDSAIYVAPLSHGAGLYNMMHVRAGAKHVLPPSLGFDPEETLALARHHGEAHMFLAPTMVQRLTRFAMESGVSGEGLRSIVYAGGPMYQADILDAVDRFGPVFLQIYGQGECPMGITALPKPFVADRRHHDWQARLSSVGVAQSAVELRIGTPTKALPHGEIGEILVRGDTVMPGYWRNETATRKTLVDGWLHTGDLGHLGPEGFLTLVDRSKDLIISGGSNIYPREVEEVLQTHEMVQEVAVIGRPSREWGEEVVAFIVSPDLLDRASLDAHCKSQMARFKCPKAYIPLPELPKNNYGKVLKSALRERLANS